jgi:hypothetical protein
MRTGHAVSDQKVRHGAGASSGDLVVAARGFRSIGVAMNPDAKRASRNMARTEDRTGRCRFGPLPPCGTDFQKNALAGVLQGVAVGLEEAQSA